MRTRIPAAAPRPDAFLGMESGFGQQSSLALLHLMVGARTVIRQIRDALGPQRQPTRGSVRMQQHRNIDVGGATLECTFYGSGTPVVLLANAGCSTGYFDDLARVLAAGGLQAISVNMRGAGESCGSLGGITVHDLAADVAGGLEASGVGSAAPLGHRFCHRGAPHAL